MVDDSFRFGMAMFLMRRSLEKRGKKKPHQKQHAFSLKRGGRYVVRKLGIFLMRVGGKLVYLGQTPFRGDEDPE